MIVNDLRDKVRRGGDEWSEAAILYRTNNQSQALEDALRRKAIPYRIYKGNSFYDHKEIRDMLGYIRLIINPRDDEAFKRIINTPARGIGSTSVDRIAVIAQSRGTSMWDAVDGLVNAASDDPTEKAVARKVAEFVALIRELSLAREAKGLYDFGMDVATRSGILQFYRMQNNPESQSAVDNIEELLNTLQLFNEQVEAEIRAGEREEFDKATIKEWLAGLMLMSDMDNEESDGNNKVTLMTVHSAKGLEYKYVYIVGCEENLFPSLQAMEDIDGLEEERRLFYVALTRAKSLATLSCAEMRFKWGNMEFSRPSRFLSEIDPQFVDSDFDLKPSRTNRSSAAEEGESALDMLRRQFDYRYQQKGNVQKTQPTQKSYAQPQRTTVESPRTIDTSKMRRVNTSTTGTVTSAPCDYAVGDVVQHTSFGRGVITKIEPMATDHKLIVEFGAPHGSKTLIARLARLTKL